MVFLAWLDAMIVIVDHSWLTAQANGDGDCSGDLLRGVAAKGINSLWPPLARIRSLGRNRERRFTLSGVVPISL